MGKYSKKELDETLAFTMEVAKEAGEKLLKFRKQVKSLKIDYKEAQGVVSQADIKTEEFIVKKIKKKYPWHEFLGEEESYCTDKTDKCYEALREKEALWIIDPLDGTHNFLNGSNYFCVSIALVAFGRPIVGVIYRPCTGEYFFAINGKGAWQIGPDTNYKKRKMFISENTKKLKDCILVTGFATEKGRKFEKEFNLFKKVMFQARAVRRFGSAALDLCYVASGLWDGFWERELAPWDVAAAGLILKESGAHVTNYEGQEFHPFQDSIVGIRKPLYKKVVKIIRSK